MSENELVNKETEVALVGQKVEQLSVKVDDLKGTFKDMVAEIHGHITRKFNDEMRIGLLELEKKITVDTDNKIATSMDSVKNTFKTWAVISVITVSCTVGIITYFTSIKSQGTTTAQEMGELYKVISQENRKNVKQTELVIKPERIVP